MFAARLAEDWWRTLTSSLAVLCCSSLRLVLVITLEAITELCLNVVSNVQCRVPSPRRRVLLIKCFITGATA